MKNQQKTFSFDAAWYCRKDAEADRFYEIFFQMCQKYNFQIALSRSCTKL